MKKLMAAAATLAMAVGAAPAQAGDKDGGKGTFLVDGHLQINWRSGSSFEKPTTVMGPRIAKFGVKFDW